MRTVEQTLIEAGRAYTIAAASGNVIGYVGDDGAGGAQLRLGKYEHKPEQEWLFDRVGENSYRIHCRANGKVIDLAMAGTANGTWLQLWEPLCGYRGHRHRRGRYPANLAGEPRCGPAVDHPARQGPQARRARGC